MSDAEPKKKKKKKKKGARGGDGGADDEKAETKGLGSWAYLLLLPLAVVIFLVARPDESRLDEREDVAALEDTKRQKPLESSDMPAVAAFVSALWKGDNASAANLPAAFSEPARAVYVAVRSDGERQYHTWRFEGTVADALTEAIGNARENAADKGDPITTIEIDLSHTYRELEWPGDRKKITSNIHRGVRGLEMRHGEARKIHAPTWFLASNRKIEKQVGINAKEWGLSDEQIREVRFRTFEAEQILVDLEEGSAVLMERGNEYVPIETVNKATAEELVRLQTQWMLNGLHPDGRMTYIWWPSVGREAPAQKNNMIRQWMATIALSRIAAHTDDSEVWDLAEKNIDYNLRRFYHEEDGLGMIEWNGKVKLGAVALAGYAILTHPKRDKWHDEEMALRKTMDALWNDSGRFKTFYKMLPSTREQPNFYPGEALFYWAEIYDRERDPEVLEKFMKSFRYYKRWHLDPSNRNPAFIPWHTEAYYQVWTVTKDDELRDFVFQMNDWLIEIQQWDDVIYRDTKGRFFSTDHWYGPPHASSTGVYTEGLIDAWSLATAEGDEARAEAYRKAIVRGLRSVMQLQFVDDVDMFYVSKKDRVVGGIRETVYVNTIRCDNVQHSLMGNLKVLQRFSEADFVHGN